MTTQTTTPPQKTMITMFRLLMVATLSVSSVSAQFGSAQQGPFSCNVCKDTADGLPARTLQDPTQSFVMNGDTWTCGYLQETVQDVNPYNGAPGEARWCALAQLWAEKPCTCNGPEPLPPPDVKDPNPACDICPPGRYQFDFVPAINAELTANTGVAGNMNCEGLYYAASEGVLTSNLCGTVRDAAGPICCNAQKLELGPPQNQSGGGGGGGAPAPGPAPAPQNQQQIVSEPVCGRPTQTCVQDRDCCPGLTCKTKTLTGPKYCASARTRPRVSIAGTGIGGAAGRVRAGK
eukprot:CAMPEP_0113452842 /NCGR_PEP_ID=MMETSP0014_2-20120614/7053_1 /TAXON_ID=2857 /ORGANISM="Nitzschia sp." /LENGTH=290 /DNA_ID=CAMNT_0000344223 /DNA_START=119 /DNA_END=991 /DNA_ORIENTATION=- /assembly_acc=CAM_ASM_000159